MPRGAKKDVPLTKMLRANSLLRDPRSFIGYQGDMTPHLYLFGFDIQMQRESAWRKCRGRCGLCKKAINEFESPWELDHIIGGLFRRCDCLHNLQVAHTFCHRLKHVHPKFLAAKDFEKLYPKETPRCPALPK